MADSKDNTARKLRYRGRDSQVLIYLGKQLRFFINENDWKVLPMAAIIAALVGMVIRKRFFINMEGSLIGGFALTCVAIWNGCFNSIQAICRERAIIKREHRSGMHISAYVFAHMIYQFLLCMVQTGLTMYVLKLIGVKFPDQGFMTPWMIVDVGITMLLISYASDMMSLFLSSISHTTTGAMTIMPFVLIFQLVFSGGVIPLPQWSRALSNYTISNYGIKALAAQSGYNELPMVTAWNTLSGMRDTKVGGSFTIGQVLDLLDSPAVEKRRDTEIIPSYTVGEVAEMMKNADEMLHLSESELTRPIKVSEIISFIQTNPRLEQLRNHPLIPLPESSSLTLQKLLDEVTSSEELKSLLDKEIGTTVTVGQVLDFLKVDEAVQERADQTFNPPVTLGQIADFLKNNEALQAKRDQSFTVTVTIGELFELFGEENVQALVQRKTAEASYKPEYERTTDNIVDNWLMLGVFIALFALMSMISLKMIDKDKR